MNCRGRLLAKCWKSSGRVIWGLAVLILFGCVAIGELAPVVDERLLAVAQEGASSAGALESGRQIYLTTCAKCHLPEPVGRYSREEWERILPEMAKLSGLDSGQFDDLKNYVLAAKAMGE
jgi:mono/diheme cytochrome c family protein